VHLFGFGKQHSMWCLVVGFAQYAKNISYYKLKWIIGFVKIGFGDVGFSLFCFAH